MKVNYIDVKIDLRVVLDVTETYCRSKVSQPVQNGTKTAHLRRQRRQADASSDGNRAQH